MIFPNDRATCVMPWDSFRILPDGRRRYCDSQLDRIEHNHTETDVIHWWQSAEKVQAARKRIRDGEELDGCARCRHSESVDGNSVRTRRHFQAGVHHGRFFRDSLEQNVLWSSMQQDQVNHLPSYITVSFSNECNSRCIMCGAESSNLVAQDHQDFKWLASPVSLQKWTDSRDGENAYQSLVRMVVHNPRLLYLQINGGEPFITKQAEIFLEDIVKAGKTDFTLVINTNGTVWNEHMVAAMQKIQNCIVDFAIETASTSNDYIRLGSQIHDIKHMIQRYKQLQNERFRLILHCVPQALSMPDFHTLIDFCHDNELTLMGNPLHTPSHLAITMLPRSVRQDIASDLMARYGITRADLTQKVDHDRQTNIDRSCHTQDDPALLPDYLQDLVVKIIKNLDQADEENQRDLQMRFIDHVTRFDQKHGRNFKTVFPILADLHCDLSPCVTI